MGIEMKFQLMLTLVAFASIGCAATYTRNFPLVEKGMSIPQVTELVGKPISAESGPGDTKILYYRLASSPLDTDGSDTREYWVQIADGEVIGYGERRDAITVMREARQFAAAWNAAKMINDAARSPAKVDIKVEVK
jgi:hypothetical protein